MKPRSEIEVRIAAPADAGLLLPMFDLFYGAYFEPKTEDAIRRNLSAAAAVDTVLIAFEDGRPTGFASLRLIPQIESDRPHAELSDLFVHPESRRHGVGRALVRFAENVARERGGSTITLTVGADNGIARSFYGAQGFEGFALAMKKPLGGGR